MNNLKKILSRGLLIFAVIALIDVCLGLYFDSYINSFNGYGTPLSKNNYRLNTTTADVVVLGTSRAVHHYENNILKEGLKDYFGEDITFFNAGIDGCSLYKNFWVIESMMKRYTPKMIVLDVNDWEFFSENEQYLNYFYPFYWKNDVVKQHINSFGFAQKIKMYSSFCRYNNFLWNIYNSSNNEEENDGYVPLFGEIFADDTTHFYEKKDFYKENIDSFKEIARLCQDRGVELIVSISPAYHSNMDHDDRIKTLCDQVGLKYFNNTNIFDSRNDYFQSYDHLNDEGAKAFSAVFLEQLKASKIR